MRAARARGLVGAVALVVGLALSGCSGGVAGTEGKGYISGDGQTILIDRADRGEPIELTGTDLDGQPLHLADYRGRPVVINVWGSWCVPCRKEMPALVSISEELKGTAELAGINIRESNEASGKAFLKNKGATWKSFYSPDGKALRPFTESGVVSPNTIPSTVVLDAEGRVAASVAGEITKPGTFIRHVQRIAAEK